MKKNIEGKNKRIKSAKTSKQKAFGPSWHGSGRWRWARVGCWWGRWRQSYVCAKGWVWQVQPWLVRAQNCGGFSWWVLQHCTGFARLVWGRLRVHRALFIQNDLCVMCVFVLYSPVSLSSCPFFGHPALPPQRGGSASRVSILSCQSHESLWNLWYSLAVLEVTITCSICYDRADDSSIHRGTYHILEST